MTAALLDPQPTVPNNGPACIPSIPLDTLVSFDSLAAAIKTPAKSPSAASVRTPVAATNGTPRNRSASTSSSCVTAVPLPLQSAPPVPPLVPASNRDPLPSPPATEHDAFPLSTLCALPEAGTPHLARVAGSNTNPGVPNPRSAAPDRDPDGDVLLPGVSVPLTHLPAAREDLRALHPKPRATLYIHGLLLKLLAAHDKSLDEADTRAIMACQLYTHRNDDSVLYAVRVPEPASSTRRTSAGSDQPERRGSEQLPRPGLRERSASDSAALQATRRWSDPPATALGPRRASASSATVVGSDSVHMPLSPPLPTASTTMRRPRRLSSTASASASLSACNAPQCSDPPAVAMYPSPPDSPRPSHTHPAPVPRLESLADLALSTPISPILRQATRTGPLLASLVLRPDLHALCLPWRAHALVLDAGTDPHVAAVAKDLQVWFRVAVLGDWAAEARAVAQTARHVSCAEVEKARGCCLVM
ncbi:hypothetical protein AMAG_00037 [Allomyces macrogynus ATCC 38327]|uniref:Uncharacterized protein n=1 Tax=Allomyces macrogynus (strain ATCC 38327) TaxID=578462 RepID=A0A0L0RV85_ALLM3|nr:hypothetical protein AMAG_00037 [Allomyces macrogynus ATCC 38327]|eukprot:KNE54034.1 hypothetical protein AMAG_00037 [Allomyces macrogynus ATCC 38327]